ncbi:MAG: IS3 family transposase [Acidiferrobacterales bacterium]
MTTGPVSEGARRATVDSGPHAPAGALDPEVTEIAKRRRFTAEYKLRILREVERCKVPGEIGALLRREGLYSSHLTSWRRERDRVAKTALAAKKRGPKKKAVDPRIKQLEHENARLKRRLGRVELMLDIQKKGLRNAGDPPESPRQRRERLMAAAEKLATGIGYTAPACDALGVSRATLYRSRCSPSRPARLRPRSHRALALQEQEQVLDILRSPRFMDRSPAQVWATLLDENVYYCSIRSMYRYLAANGEIKERRNQLCHPNYKKPELLAEAPNQVWTWDITKLRGPAKWTYFHLYVIMDIFSRYVVGWMVAHRESAALAKRLISATCRKQGIVPEQLTIHADRGASMRSKTVALLLSDLGVVKSHSRPHVSNDNPYSESQFKTMKYCPQFPGRFGSIQDARGFGSEFFDYYNNEHRHAGIGLLTPAVVHYGQAEQIIAARQDTLLAAYRAHPERFVKRPPQPPAVPSRAWINPPIEKAAKPDQPVIVTPVSGTLEIAL